MTSNDAGVVAIYDGDTASAIKWGRKGVERARRDADPVRLLAFRRLRTAQHVRGPRRRAERGRERGPGRWPRPWHREHRRHVLPAPRPAERRRGTQTPHSRSLRPRSPSASTWTRRQSFRQLGRGRSVDAPPLEWRTGSWARRMWRSGVCSLDADDGERSITRDGRGRLGRLGLVVRSRAGITSEQSRRAAPPLRSRRSRQCPFSRASPTATNRDRGRPSGGRGRSSTARPSSCCWPRSRPCRRRAHVAQRPRRSGASDLDFRWWRGWDLNPRPSGYEFHQRVRRRQASPGQSPLRTSQRYGAGLRRMGPDSIIGTEPRPVDNALTSHGQPAPGAAVSCLARNHPTRITIDGVEDPTL